MQTTLAATALLMGLVGGPHCLAMCGAACAGIGQAAGARSGSAIVAFQAGRILGYTALGAAAAATVAGMGWLTVQSAALRPVWTLFHVLAFFIGLLLLLKAKQPVWMEAGAKRIWQQVRKAAQGLMPTARQGAVLFAAGSAPAALSAPSMTLTWFFPGVMGVCWALLPCGLLYSALLVAAMTGQVAQGAAVMALFALGSSVSMLAGPWLWLRLKNSGHVAGDGTWGVRLAGLALAASSAWALWMGIFHNTAPWCVAA
jgi:uncharacterized protein